MTVEEKVEVFPTPRICGAFKRVHPIVSKLVAGGGV